MGLPERGALFSYAHLNLLIMSDWTSGYVTAIDYTYGYYNELNPLRSEFTFVHAGIKPPSLGVHCELGFGQGLSIAILKPPRKPDPARSREFQPTEFLREENQIQ